MPELPEVETVKNGLIKNIIGKKIKDIKINIPKLRYDIDKNKNLELKDKTIKSIERRGKHLIIFLDENLQLIIHLGMSGVLSIVSKIDYKYRKHDHIELILNDDTMLVYNDTRRFGYWLINENNNPESHKVLSKHGVEPLTDDFKGKYLFEKAQKTSKNIKQLIMDNSIVVGVGNIYASEALFASSIIPTKKSNTLSLKQANKLSIEIKRILKEAIAQGGTTLKDYKNTSGKPGYFSQKLNVYGRKGELCYNCGSVIESLVIAQRNTFFCKKCQK